MTTGHKSSFNLPGKVVLSPAVEAALERIMVDPLGAEFDTYAFLDLHQRDVLEVWSELKCTATARALGIIPSILDSWRRDRDLTIPE